jgi:GABA(A) receptor-associated protein
MDFLKFTRPKPSVSDYNFKAMHTPETRMKESARILKKYPDKSPLIVEKSDSSDVSDLEDNKWIIKQDLTVGQLIYIIRKRIKAPTSETLIIYVDNKYLPNTGDMIGHLYKRHKDKDGFLYITYSKMEFLG